MLRGLDIRDILIIDRLELEFQPGLNVLTGETGAGKSILLDSLGFVLGWRGRADLVRSGADQGEVTAEFDLPQDHPARAVLAEAGIEADDEVILRRVNRADGRKTAWVNDRRVSGDVLRALSDCLIELHGQQDDRGLLNPRVHRQLLDAFGGLEGMLSDTRSAWRKLSSVQTALAEARAALVAAQAEEDFLRHAVEELDKLDPQPGEDAELDQRRRMMQASEKIGEDIQRALQAMGAMGEGAEARMGDALRWLEGVVDQAGDSLDEPIQSLGRAMAELSDAMAHVEATLDQLTFNPHELEEIEERLFAIRGLARKYQVQPDELGTHAEVLRDRLNALDAGVDQIAALENAVAESQESYDLAATALQAARQKAARSLDSAMGTELAPLKMERAVFTTQLTQTDPGPEGTDVVTFTVATNPGAPSGPLNKIASGGELSRFLLALKVCLTRDADGLTMIFDEIDRGVGGATADAVGRRLKSLSEGGQVLVVTHSPQVAALGDHHWRVQKSVTDGMTLSTVVPLCAKERVDELARMISGDTITPAAKAAAQELLNG
ncbi:DNA repair protein RecN [Aliiroseovarius crassostreae]|uniref:DNA repair protein RecN n=1 Tax=Aliiroseovarius crassostreae TaxID=154981 RepID=UPI0021AF368A|nr:DNA repair protein RecN [Aliiroseovarius crassostreae]UWQ09063.1 DNA repair protein RecN [Aliiroseovarius crassostreae]